MRGNEIPCINLATQIISNKLLCESRNVCAKHAAALLVDEEGWGDARQITVLYHTIPCDWGREK